MFPSNRVFPTVSFEAQARSGEIVLFPDGAPGEIADWPGPEVESVGSDGTTRVFNVSTPTLTPYLLSNASAAAPTVIVAPGGGYSKLSVSKEGYDVAARLNAMGAHAFVLKYRVPARPDDASLPKWWAPLQDAQRAVSWVRAHATVLGLNASNVGFAGFSAGGHLTAHVSTALAKIYRPRDAADELSSPHHDPGRSV